MNVRRLLPVASAAAFLAVFGTAAAVVTPGCVVRNEPIVVGDVLTDDPAATLPWWLMPPSSRGGGPPSCHDPDLELNPPSEVPRGFDEPDDSALSPAHPPHLKRGRGIEDNI
jgi:hypothetical protein